MGLFYVFLISFIINYNIFMLFQRIGVIKRNEQPTTDLCDRMVILSTSFGHNNDLFQDTELKKISTEVMKNGS